MDALVEWVRQQVPTAGELVPVSGDAGFRRYFRVVDTRVADTRVVDTQSGKTLVVMDASADKASCLPFTFMAEQLRANGLRAPRILMRGLDRGSRKGAWDA